MTQLVKIEFENYIVYDLLTKTTFSCMISNILSKLEMRLQEKH